MEKDMVKKDMVKAKKDVKCVRDGLSMKGIGVHVVIIA